ncbi:MAG: glycosyltransferase [Candidatus Aureabacteria bacterium]|nr:glycosyltransferase [Candidatus Auribacterota bacterium]
MQINQILPGFGSGDAISGYALQLQEIVRSWGHESALYCPSRHVGPTETHLCQDYRLLSPGDSDITIYHYSVASELTGFFSRLKGRKVLVYHNITPHTYLEGVHDEKARALRLGREELKSLARIADLALGDSEFNRRELEAEGFRRTATLPLIVDAEKLSGRPDSALMKQFGDGAANILFVGRVAPNKCIEDLIKIFYYYRITAGSRSRLIVAGSLIGMDRYTSHLRALITILDLPDVVFLNHVSDQELYALYRTAHVFLCMSEHEGFCMPLLEAMHFNLPVVAYAAGAVPETLGGAGVLVREKDHAAIAELLDTVCRDRALREAIVRKQLARLPAFSTEAVRGLLRAQLDSLY